MIIERITEAIQDSLVVGSLIIKNQIHLLATMAIYLFNHMNKRSCSKIQIETMNQILNNNHNNSNSHNKTLTCMHQTEITLQQNQTKPKSTQKQPNQTSSVEGDDDYVNAITDFFFQTIKSPNY